MAWKWSSTRYFTSCWTCKSICNFYWNTSINTSGKFKLKNKINEKSIQRCASILREFFQFKDNEFLFIRTSPSFLHSATWSAHIQTLASRSYAKPGEHWYRLASPFQQFQKTSHLFSSAKIPYNREQCDVEIAGSKFFIFFLFGNDKWDI